MLKICSVYAHIPLIICRPGRFMRIMVFYFVRLPGMPSVKCRVRSPSAKRSPSPVSFQIRPPREAGTPRLRNPPRCPPWDCTLELGLKLDCWFLNIESGYLLLMLVLILVTALDDRRRSSATVQSPAVFCSAVCRRLCSGYRHSAGI